MGRPLVRRRLTDGLVDFWTHGLPLFGIPALFAIAVIYPRLPVLPDVSLCAVRGFLGIPCPGCGLTHALIALVRGQVRQSIDAHPLGIVVALWLAVLFIRSVIAAVAGRPPRALLTQRQRDWLVGLFLVALFFQWIFHLVLGLGLI